MAYPDQPFYVIMQDGTRRTIYAPSGCNCKAALDYNGMLMFEVQKIATSPI